MATSLSTSLERSAIAEANNIRAIAEKANIWGFPLWLQEKYLERSRQSSTPVNRFSLSSQLARPEDRNVGPNVNTLYGDAWLAWKLSQWFYVPDTSGRYYCIQFIDAYSNSFQLMTLRGTLEEKPGGP